MQGCPAANCFCFCFCILFSFFLQRSPPELIIINQSTTVGGWLLIFSWKFSLTKFSFLFISWCRHRWRSLGQPSNCCQPSHCWHRISIRQVVTSLRHHRRMFCRVIASLAEVTSPIHHPGGLCLTSCSDLWQSVSEVTLEVVDCPEVDCYVFHFEFLLTKLLLLLFSCSCLDWQHKVDEESGFTQVISCWLLLSVLHLDFHLQFMT